MVLIEGENRLKFSDLQGKVVLVTGASRGIGAALAQAFAGQGAMVIGTATTAEGADAITDRLSGYEAPGQGLVLNVQDTQAIYAVVEDISARIKAPEILINNAGMTRDNLFLRMKTEEWDEVIQTNLSSVFHLSKAVVRAMIKARWGRIINISSVVGETGNAGQVNYTAAKAGVIAMTKSLAQEIASRHITVNAIAPGFIATDMTSALTDAQREAIINHVPMGRMGTSDEIAHSALFLASDLANYITGQTLHVNGGMFMR